jgi:hypothetical protein
MNVHNFQNSSSSPSIESEYFARLIYLNMGRDPLLQIYSSYLRGCGVGSPRLKSVQPLHDLNSLACYYLNL